MTPRSTQQERRLDRLSHRTRRILAVATLLGLPAMFGWSTFWMSTTAPTILWGPVSFVLIGVTAIGALVLYRFVRDRADLPGARLDERERQLRDRAWILSYEILALVVVVVVAAIAIAVLGLGRTVVLDASVASAAALCLGVLLPVLPVAALAWIQPDAPADV